MSSRPPSLVVADQYVSSPSHAFPPPPPPRSGDGPRPDGLRRDHVARLSPLTTNLPPHSAHPLRTPQSATSLSSPFTQSLLGPHSAAAAGSRGLSPMALRSAYSVPYNPSQWASGTRRPQPIESQSVHQEDGVPVPPPPYSPPRSQRTSSTSDSTVFSSGETVLSPETQLEHPPLSAISAVMSPISVGTSMIDSSTSFVDSEVSSPMSLPPPPPRNSSVDQHRRGLSNRARPMSVTGLSQIMILSSQFGQDQSRAASPTQNAMSHPPNSRRAASTGDVSSTASRSQGRDASNSRSSSQQRGWHPGMPLPPPPPGLPPASSRSQSASKAPEDARGMSPGPSTRPFSYRVPLKPPMLSPMPPTPAGWSEDTPIRATNRPAVALHINTNIGESSGHRQVHPYTEPVAETGSISSTGLIRSAALRDTSAKGLRERRNQRRSIHEAEGQQPLVVATNPWAEAMLSAASTTKSPTTFSESTRPNESQMTSPLLEKSISNLPSKGQVSSLFQELGLSPMSPMGRSVKNFQSPVQQHQPRSLPTPPLSQKASASTHSVRLSSFLPPNDLNGDAYDEAATASLQRHREFLALEGAATNDVEKFQVFADYLVAESVLRQKRYENAISEYKISIEAIRQRLFDETDPVVQNKGQSQHSVATAEDSTSYGFPNDATARVENGWHREYKPALSPIASMSNDERSSRGRTSSRWWEGSQTDGTGQNKVRRSKRESKYMGLSTTLMGAAIEERDTPTYLDFPQQSQEDQYPNEKANPEAFGVYDEDGAVHQTEGLRADVDLLDVSRFITLPPPYPRHYPAVNNSHPDLANYRLTVRSLSDLGEIKSRKARHASSVEALRRDHKQKTAKVRQEFKSNVQAQIAQGTISYAEAAEAEDALKREELQQEKETLQAEFDTLQDVVMKPLHDLLNDRLVQLSSHIGDLTEKLHIDAQHENPNRPQQEGDDTPELLEYLTQLKWLFETREQTHKEIFDLLTERNEKYKDIVTLPYRQAKNTDKVRGTEQFFSEDRVDRHKAYCKEALARHTAFYKTVEEHVSLGVQRQSSAFWDIAPVLLEVLQKMPADVANLDRIAIPENEYLENPSYYRFPQQYLYTLVDHAEKSTYQFIESQINLHCLLHEVKSSMLLAECREMESQPNSGAMHTPKSALTPRTAHHRSKEEAILTAELKQKVSMIEQQWLEALGSQLQDTQDRVKLHLEEKGGWEDMIERAEE